MPRKLPTAFYNFPNFIRLDVPVDDQNGRPNTVEGIPIIVVRGIFETNTIGTIAIIKAMLPKLRACRAGEIIIVTASVKLKADDMLPVYTASKP